MSSDNDTPEREQQVVDLLRTAAAHERAPAALRARVAAMRSEVAATPGRRLLPRPAGVLARVALPAAAALAAVIVLALGGGAGAPSIAQAAALATRAPTAPAPAADAREPGQLLTARVGVLHFPNWQSAGGWRAVGQRQDHLGDRTATTVYYTAGSRRVVYSIVSSPTLTMKDVLMLQSRPAYGTISHRGRITVVWQEAGHTCLLTGSRGMTVAQLTWLVFRGFH